MKPELLKHWKPELEPLGFVYKDGMFVCERGESPFLFLGVSVQKNISAATYKINPSILFRNPCVSGSPPELLLLGNLRNDGIYLHLDRTSWWPVEALPDALEQLKKSALPWFQTFGALRYLADGLETAIREKKSVVEVIEPVDELSSSLPWAPPPSGRVGPLLYYQASVLHCLLADQQRAIERTTDWLNSLSPASVDSAKALAQLQHLQGQ